MTPTSTSTKARNTAAAPTHRESAPRPGPPVVSHKRRLPPSGDTSWRCLQPWPSECRRRRHLPVHHRAQDLERSGRPVPHTGTAGDRGRNDHPNDRLDAISSHGTPERLRDGGGNGPPSDPVPVPSLVRHHQERIVWGLLRNDDRDHAGANALPPQHPFDGDVAPESDAIIVHNDA
jgi:hypothetical protein